ncbi:hypothetical protein KIPB_014880, partial [Kipferlia bialata]|eukprot:g14880.t1
MAHGVMSPVMWYLVALGLSLFYPIGHFASLAAAVPLWAVNMHVY